MIKNLNGIHETVDYRENTNLRLWQTSVYEEFPPHWHTAIEVIMPLKNEYHLRCGDTVYTLHENDILLICPGILHHLYASEGDRLFFQAEVSSVTAIREIDSVLTAVSPALLITPEIFPDEYDKLRSLLLEIVEEYKNSSPLFEASIYARLLDFLVIVGRSRYALGGGFHAGSSKKSEYQEAFIEICNYINEHCTENLTLDSVADRCGFSKYHFTRLFKQFTNISFYKYLNLKRIARAQTMLINPAIPVTEVSLSCGFSSLSSFIRMFKLITGYTPSQFRKMYKSRE